MLHVVALAQFATAYARGWAADSVNTRVRLKAELDQANHNSALLREETRIEDARMAQRERTIGHTIRPPNARRFSGGELHVAGYWARRPRPFGSRR